MKILSNICQNVQSEKDFNPVYVGKFSNFSAYSSASIIRSWSNDIDFFLSLRILRSFNLINKNRLKNIFKRYVKNGFLWKEIDKMFSCGFINISSDLIYNFKDFLGDSLLSSFLLNLYLKEFDDFMFNITQKYNLRKNFYNKLGHNYKIISNYNFTLKRFSPLRLEENLSHLNNLKAFVTTKYKCDFLIRNFFRFNNLSFYIFFCLKLL